MIVEIERSLLGAFMLASDELLAARADGLAARHFSTPGHAAIFSAMAALLDEGAEPDLVLVASRMERGMLAEIGGAAALASLEQSCLSSAAAPDYVATVMEASRRRSLAESAKRLYTAATGDDPLDGIVHAHRAEVEGILADGCGSAGVGFAEAADAAMVDIARARTAGCSGLKMHIPSLDRLVGGLRPGSLAILAARPSVGKTALALNVAVNVALGERVPVLFFSLEMDAEELAVRCLCRNAGVSLAAVGAGFATAADMSALDDARLSMEGLRITIIDDAFALDRIVALARRTAARRDAGLVVIDYLQLVSVPRARGASTNDMVAGISRALKLLAKELGVPVLVLSQLSREVERRGGGRPMLSDLRDSGAIEQDADLVLFLHTDEAPERRGELGVLSAIVAKNRAGQCGQVPLHFNRRTQAIGELKQPEWPGAAARNDAGV